MSISEQIESAIAALESLRPDADKVDKGMTGAPGTRVRKTAMEIKKSMDSIRKAVISARS